MIGAIFGDLWPYIAGAVGALFGAFALYRKGRTDARQQTALNAAEAYARTRKEMDDAQGTVGNDPDAARRWLSERAAADKR